MPKPLTSTGKKIKEPFPQKATIILIMKDGTILHGKGGVNGLRTRIGNEAVLTATLVIPIPK